MLYQSSLVVGSAAGVNCQNQNGQTAVDFAQEFGSGLCCTLLEAAGGKGMSLRRRGGNNYLGQRGPFGGAPMSDEVQDMNDLD